MERFINLGFCKKSMADGIKPLEILVIDDDSDIRKILERLLITSGYGVTLASSGNHGIQEYAKSVEKGEPFRLVFTDLIMEDGTGIDVTRAIKSKNPDTAVYGMTGYEADKDHERLKAELEGVGPDGILQKPFSFPLIKGIAQQVALGQNHKQFAADYLARQLQDKSQS